MRESRPVEYPSRDYDPTTIEACYVDDNADTAPNLAHRFYVFSNASKPSMVLGTVQFQRGPVGARRSTPGVFLTHLIAICIYMVRQYLAVGGSQADIDANTEALDGLQRAFRALIARRDARAEARVLNTMAPTPVAPPVDTTD